MIKRLRRWLIRRMYEPPRCEECNQFATVDCGGRPRCRWHKPPEYEPYVEKPITVEMWPKYKE